MTKFLKLDWFLIASVFSLLTISLLILYSISFSGMESDFSNFKRQIISIIIGVGGMFFLAFFDYRKFDSHSTKIYFLILILLLAVVLFGKTVRGNTGWLGFADYRIQPVEFAKLVVVVFLASFLSRKKTKLSILTRTITSIVLVALPIFLVLRQPDLGSSIVIAASWATMLVLSGLSKKNLFILIIAGMLALSPGWFLMKDYQKDRIVNFIHPERDLSGGGYNVNQAIIAVGSGKFMGKGLGHGSQSQLNFLPEKHTDFIFAVIAEEVGFLGVSVVLVLFAIIFWRMKEMARLARDNFGYLLVVGIMAMIFFQLFINVGMNIGIMPVTGIPLPLLSYGGNSIIVTLAALGVIQNIYMKRQKVELTNRADMLKS